jgi:hypothetical protein
MSKSALLASTAAALLLCAMPATAQMSPNEKSAPSPQREPGQAAGQKENRGPESESKQKGSEPKGKGSAQGEMKEQQPGKAKGSAEKGTEPKAKGSAEKATEPKGKGSAEKQGTDKQGTKEPKGTAEKTPQSKDKDKAAGGSDKATGKAGRDDKGAKESDTARPGDKGGSRDRVQLSEEKRSNFSQTLLKDRNVNRARNVNISINIGTRVPRSVRLVALPAAVLAIVPEYRSYRYVVVDEQICIVDPQSYEIVEVIPASGGGMAARGGSGSEKLVLTEEERSIVLAEIDMNGGSTMGLGSLSEGSNVPRDAEVLTFPQTVVQKVPKLKEYKYVAAENRLAIVDGQGTKVQLVLEKQRR